MSRSPSIRILGAGVAGLAAATALAADVLHIELLDERFEFPSIETSLGMFDSAQRALVKLGVLDEVRRVSVAPRQGAIHGQDGRTPVMLPAGDALLLACSDLVRIPQDLVRIPQEAALGVLGLFSADGPAEPPGPLGVPEG